MNMDRMILFALGLFGLVACAYNSPAEFVYAGAALAKHHQCAQLPQAEAHNCYKDLRRREQEMETLGREETERRDAVDPDSEESAFARAMRENDR